MILLFTSIATLIAWIGLTIARLPLSGPPRLQPAHAPALWPPVTAVIPARDEEETIGEVITAHLTSTYPGEMSVVVVDDHSKDRTAEIVNSATGGPRRVELLRAPPLGAGWTGKLAAVNAGLAHAAEISPQAKYVLLTDADIIMSPDALAQLVTIAEEENLALTSLMARLDSRGFWGSLLIPAFVYFFYKLYPFHIVNDRSSRLAAAAGGCMLVRRDALNAIGGVASIKSRLIDDCALAAEIKNNGGAVWLGVADDEAVSLRDNRSLASIWKMVARSAFTQLRHSWLLLAGTSLGMLFIYLAAPMIALTLPAHGNNGAAAISAAAWALMAATYFPIARIYGKPPLATLSLPAAAFLYTLMTISSAIDHARGTGGQWKGRIYPA